MIDILLISLIIIQWVFFQYEKKRLEQANYKLCEQWIAERQQLLDRIQAPSFAEYKQAEVKVIKASKEEPPTERIELL